MRFESEPVRIFTEHFGCSQAAAGPVRQGLWSERRDWVALWHSGNIDNSLHCKVVGSLPICGHSNVVLHLGRTGLSIVFIERHHHDIGVCYFNLSIWMPVSGFIMFQQLRN